MALVLVTVEMLSAPKLVDPCLTNSYSGSMNHNNFHPCHNSPIDYNSYRLSKDYLDRKYLCRQDSLKELEVVDFGVV